MRNATDEEGPVRSAREEALHAGAPATDPGVGVPTGTVARRLGVSPTTIRSWERRYGIGPSHRGPGRHRRWSPEDISLLDEMCRLTARGIPPAEAARSAAQGAHRTSDDGPLPARPATAGEPAAARSAPEPAHHPRPGGSRAMPLGTVRPECRGLARAAVRLDGPEVAEILRGAVDALGPVRAWTEVMMPALRAAGRKWAADGEQYVEVEHLLSWHVSAALRTAAVAPVRYREAPPVLLAAMPGEQHTLPLEAVAAGMAVHGLPYRMLGAAVPPRALLDAVTRLGPSAVLLWAQSRATADPHLAREVGSASWGAAGARLDTLVATVGPGWNRHEPLTGLACPRTLEAALDLVHRAVAARAPSAADPPERKGAPCSPNG
ncbi:MerR family transcriptional regulator [Kitasatospora cineracea]|uniref:B12 binding protein n=1 Tax=Kitasatospora cineracea TaxID=88074 RepID=A0A8G1UQ30_9ACTN|nr:MerR family transcriptional regulator [Kitasatospora cineracea]ROR46949.1 B12 binding protein [Kitasatospora cineracea]